MDEKLLSISETAKLLDVCENTLRDWDIEGKFKAERTTGGHRRYTLAQIRKYLDENPPKDNLEAFSNATPPNQCPEIIRMWEKSGHLDGLTSAEQKVMAIILENTRLMWIICQNPILSSSQAIWLTHQGWLRSRLRKIVSVQPLLGPCGMTYFLQERNGCDVIMSEATVAKMYKCDFSIFKKADFESVKEVYADALAMNIDNFIFDRIEKTELDLLRDAMRSGDNVLKSMCDYVIVPEDQEEDFQDQGVDVYGLPTLLDPKTFDVMAAMGRYPSSYLTLPIFSPYVMLMEAPSIRNGTASLMFRSGWFDRTNLEK